VQRWLPIGLQLDRKLSFTWNSSRVRAIEQRVSLGKL
jgi:hypothetical protein